MNASKPFQILHPLPQFFDTGQNSSPHALGSAQRRRRGLYDFDWKPSLDKEAQGGDHFRNEVLLRNVDLKQEGSSFQSYNYVFRFFHPLFLMRAYDRNQILFEPRTRGSVRVQNIDASCK
jgi:hypothetical protein